MGKATVLALGMLAAYLLAMVYDKSMIFVEQLFISGQVFHEKGLKVSIAAGIWAKVKTPGDAPGISIDDKDRLPSGIEYY